MPTLNNYLENVSFPPYASTGLRADSFAYTTGTIIGGNLSWTNVAGAHAANIAYVTVHNITVTGTFTVTDDAGAPSSNVLFSGDETSGIAASLILIGGFVSNTTTKLSEVRFTNATIQGVGLLAGSGANSASLFVNVCSVLAGDITAFSVVSNNSLLSVNSITTANAGGSTFRSTQFNNHPCLLTCFAGASFDGPSWRSFKESGGTRSAGTTVLVQGGYSGGSVEGATLPSTGTVNVSLNGNGATTGYTGNNSGNHYETPGLTAPLTVKLLVGGGELDGDTLLISKSSFGSFTITVTNSASSILGVIPSGNRGFLLARYKASDGDWVFEQGGFLS